ncbi:UspA [Rubrobacter xylanophilus DSM 9941]|uniref:UspA n=1 Tax=Rubrobacter xylanophilus (strain DSM 9941 / JCM 11954 / NBRC 16129 / PRD-1) TaxID=266117 RepID=Q1ARD0_RUBXD|nr:universal stress protein [Rubrobacter xylanophilus]ABG06048.1 UspA [Rubrobacter xylanophilus DSM 9941]
MDGFPEKVLLATDGSAGAALALRAAADLCAGAGSELHVVHVLRTFEPVPSLEGGPAADAPPRTREARELLSGEVAAAASAVGGEVEGHLREGRPEEEICALARELGAGLIVVGRRGLGTVERLVTGSVSEGVVGLAPCPVLVVKGGREAWPPSRVVVGDDTSEEARRAGELAADIAPLLGATLQLVRAFPVIVGVSGAARLAEDAAAPLRVALGRHEVSLLARARALEGRLGYRPRVSVREGEAASVLLAVAREGGEGPALVAVGRRGLGGLDRLRLGSVSTRVLRAAPGPVLVCPG